MPFFELKNGRLSYSAQQEAKFHAYTTEKEKAAPLI
jgi:hypothetical protein